MWYIDYYQSVYGDVMRTKYFIKKRKVLMALLKTKGYFYALSSLGAQGKAERFEETKLSPSYKTLKMSCCIFAKSNIWNITSACDTTHLLQWAIKALSQKAGLHTRSYSA
jgi:hypothetical protein